MTTSTITKKEYQLREMNSSKPGSKLTVFGVAKVPLQQSTQYDSLAAQFVENDRASNHMTRKLLYDSFTPADLRKKNVLDLGCGYGRDGAYMAKRGARVFGVDESAALLRIAKKECPSGKFMRADFSNLPFYDNFFDATYSRYALQHTADLEPAFYELSRVMKPGAKFTFIVTHPLRQYFEKPTRDYDSQEACTSHIFDKKMTVSEPSHRFTEYFSPMLLNNFTLERVVEKVDVEAERVAGCGRYPGILMVEYRRNDRQSSCVDMSNELIMLDHVQNKAK